MKKERNMVCHQPKECKLLDSPVRKELIDIMKQKKMEKSTCYHLLVPRSEHKRQEKLPLLKGKYPSAFGV